MPDNLFVLYWENHTMITVKAIVVNVLNQNSFRRIFEQII